MHWTTIENTDKWRVDSYGNGLAYTFTDKATGQSSHIQGDDATSWREEYDEYQTLHTTPNTRHHRLTWNELLAELCGPYIWH